jgi:hypothetical protein
MSMLYHGTAARHLERIEREGLCPRAQTRVASNWKHTVPSNPRAVYLTDAYPFHFAYCASGNSHDKGLILEIDRGNLPPWLLCPDEDALEQGTRRVPPTEANGTAPIEWSMLKRTRFYRKIAPFNSKLADASLEIMGTAAYYGCIPFQWVRRYVIIDWKQLDPSIYFSACDTMVSTINYRILASRHKALIRWFFNDPVEPIELTAFADWPAIDMPPEVSKQLEHTKQAMSNRTGLTVVQC